MDAPTINVTQVQLPKLNISTINFTSNCTAVGELFGTQGPQDYDTEGVLKPELLYLAFPEDFRQNFSEPEIDAELQDYITNYLFRPGSNFTKAKEAKLVEDTRKKCWKEICDTAYRNYVGNPDIGGIGVSLAMRIVVAFLTRAGDDRIRLANPPLHYRNHRARHNTLG
jgi:hypothetical protein